MSAQTLPLNFFVGGTMLMLVVLGLGVAVLMPGPDR